MFDSYENIPQGYKPTNRPLNIDTRLPKKPLAIYGPDGEVVGFSWCYGDGVVLDFSTVGYVTDDFTGYYQDAETYLKNKVVKLQLFDHRHNVVHEDVLGAGVNVKFIITPEASMKLLRNTYTCSLKLFDEDGREITTLFKESDSKFYVK